MKLQGRVVKKALKGIPNIICIEGFDNNEVIVSIGNYPGLCSRTALENKRKSS